MSIADNIKNIQDSLAKACASASRDPDEIVLVAVSKQKSAADILAAVEAGLQHFGENRVEESRDKIGQVNERARRPLTWHMVGHVQSRKAKQMLPLFDMIQSVDSMRLARKLARLAQERNQSLDVLLEMNVSGEASKYGFAAYKWYHNHAVKERLWQEVDEIAKLPHIHVKGLMTMAPFDADMESARAVFADLAALRGELSNSLDIPLPELSMGMTNDYPAAVKEGATMLRIGRAVFGER